MYNMTIPQSDILTTNRLGKIFSNTVATYKFFWFVSIMQIHAKSDNPRISVWDIVIRGVNPRTQKTIGNIQR